MANRHLSFSGMDKYNFCPNAYKIIYLDGAPRVSNIFTVFGKAVHFTIEEILNENINPENATSTFQKKFKEIGKEEELKIPENLELIFREMWLRGGPLAALAVTKLKECFRIKRVIATEEELLEPIFHPTRELKDDYDFKGFIDLILELEDGSWVVVDWKTCGWGWNAKKKGDTMKHYQLTLYKHFATLKHDLDPKKIKETYFALVKRSAFNKDGKPKDNAIEFVRVTCGPKKVQNALKVLNKTMVNVDKGFFPKNRLSCDRCDFFKTEWCSG